MSASLEMDGSKTDSEAKRHLIEIRVVADRAVRPCVPPPSTSTVPNSNARASVTESSFERPSKIDVILRKDNGTQAARTRTASARGQDFGRRESCSFDNYKTRVMRFLTHFQVNRRRARAG